MSALEGFSFTMAELAFKMYDAGLMPIAWYRVMREGKPTVLPPKHKEYFDSGERPPREIILKWFRSRKPECGIGLMTGKLSGNLEMLEFEGRGMDVFAAWCSYMVTHHPDLFEKVYSNGWVDISPSGGIHIYYRVDCEQLPVSTELVNIDGKVLAETRGRKGLAKVAPSGAHIGKHPPNAYKCLEFCGFENIPLITVEEQTILWKATGWTEPERVESTPSSASKASGEGLVPSAAKALKPIHWIQVLELAGWETAEFLTTDSFYVIKPNATDDGGHHGTVNYEGNDRLIVHSTATKLDSVDPNNGLHKTYDKFEVLVTYKFQGDKIKCAKWVLETYGKVPDYGKPAVVVNDRPFEELRDEIVTLMGEAQAESPSVFMRGGGMVMLTADERDNPIIREITLPSLRNFAADSVAFVQRRFNKEGEVWDVPSMPFRDVLESILSLPYDRLPFKPLRGITEVPIIHEDGSIRFEQGYDETSQLYFKSNLPLDTLSVPDDPSMEQVQAAVAVLEELFCDFPFVDKASRTNALAFLITGVIRKSIKGPTPMAVIDATGPAQGKSLIMDVAHRLITGREIEEKTYPEKEEELRKLLTGYFRKGSPLISFDNVRGAINSPVLEGVLTGTAWSDRLLGQNENVSLPAETTWAINGNGISLRGELSRRLYWIRIAARTNRPQNRDDFKIPNLKVHVLETRCTIIESILTLHRAWHVAGRPKPTGVPRLGSFENWCWTLGGILEVAGVKDFLGNAEEQLEANDYEVAEWEIFLQTLKEEMPKQFEASEVVRRIEADRMFEGMNDNASNTIDWRAIVPQELVNYLGRPGVAKRFGDAFATKVGRYWNDGGLRIEKIHKSPNSKKSHKWQIVVGTGDRSVPPS